MMAFKKLTALILTGVLTVTLAGCGGKDKGSEDIEKLPEAAEEQAQESQEPADAGDTEVVSDLEATISWWTYPMFVQDEGNADGTYEQELIQQFNKKYPNIKVNLAVLDYTEGPDKLQSLIESEAGELPDVLLDGPGRISTYARAGVLADLGSMFSDEMESDMVSQGLLSACRDGEDYVMYPLSASNYVMAFNRNMLEGSGAIELMNREGACIWTTEAFEQVLERLDNSGFNSGTLYCSGIAGDYATRSFITNLYDGSLMNEELTAYDMSSEANRQALDKVREWMEKGWILNGTGESGADAVNNFVKGERAYCLLWSLPQAISNADMLAENEVEVVVMPYPSADGEPSLEYILNGFCVFSHEDEKRVEASKYLIDFICNDESVAAENVRRSGAFPVKASMSGLYEGNEEAGLYEALLPYSGTYFNKVNGFEEMRIYWYQMLTEILNGEYSVKESTESFVEYANKTLEEEES